MEQVSTFEELNQDGSRIVSMVMHNSQIWIATEKSIYVANTRTKTLYKPRFIYEHTEEVD